MANIIQYGDEQIDIDKANALDLAALVCDLLNEAKTYMEDGGVRSLPHVADAVDDSWRIANKLHERLEPLFGDESKANGKPANIREWLEQKAGYNFDGGEGKLSAVILHPLTF